MAKDGILEKIFRELNPDADTYEEKIFYFYATKRKKIRVDYVKSSIRKKGGAANG